MTKLEKEDVKHIWIDQIKTAKKYADSVIEQNGSDDGTCNFDMCLVKREKMFTYDETIAIFEECGVKACRGSEYSSFYRGYVAICELHGQADRNTRWAESFKESLEVQGFRCSMYYQCD